MANQQEADILAQLQKKRAAQKEVEQLRKEVESKDDVTENEDEEEKSEQAAPINKRDRKDQDKQQKQQARSSAKAGAGSKSKKDLAVDQFINQEVQLAGGSKKKNQ